MHGRPSNKNELKNRKKGMHFVYGSHTHILVLKILTLENLAENKEFIFKLGPIYFTLAEIFRKF